MVSLIRASNNFVQPAYTIFGLQKIKNGTSILPNRIKGFDMCVLDPLYECAVGHSSTMWSGDPDEPIFIVHRCGYSFIANKRPCAFPDEGAGSKLVPELCVGCLIDNHPDELATKNHQYDRKLVEVRERIWTLDAELNNSIESGMADHVTQHRANSRRVPIPPESENESDIRQHIQKVAERLAEANTAETVLEAKKAAIERARHEVEVLGKDRAQKRHHQCSMARERERSRDDPASYGDF